MSEAPPKLAVVSANAEPPPEPVPDTKTVAPQNITLVTAGEVRLATAAAGGVKRDNVFRRFCTILIAITSWPNGTPKSPRSPSYYDASLASRELRRL